MQVVSHIKRGPVDIRGKPTNAHKHSLSDGLAKAAVLANMYQRIPYDTLQVVVTKRPLNYAMLQLPPSPVDATAYADWCGDHPFVVSFDEAKRAKSAKRGGPHSFRDTTFARWKTHTFTKEATLESALAHVEHANSSSLRVMKFIINFSDGVHIALQRRVVEDPSSLECVKLYDPNAAFRSKTKCAAERSTSALKKKLNFLVGDDGHLISKNMRPPTPSGQPYDSFSKEVLYRDMPPPTAGKVGYDFTPMSTLMYMVKPHIADCSAGYRRGIRATSVSSLQFRPRPGSPYAKVWDDAVTPNGVRAPSPTVPVYYSQKRKAGSRLPRPSTASPHMFHKSTIRPASATPSLRHSEM